MPRDQRMTTREWVHGAKRTCRLHCAMSAIRGQSGKHVLALSFSGFDPNETSTLDRRRPDRSRLRLHQALLQPFKSSGANSSINSYLMGKVRMGRYLSCIAQKATRSVQPVKLKWILPSKQSQWLTCETIWRN